MSTIIISVVLIAIVGGIIYKMVRDHKAGKTGCSCGCENCAMSESCHPESKS
ncbi:FeoB-associated Cys-rich membrane protein [Eubacteriales bacterium OttesenSCG-928-N13]|nr:FeoB-associated Cys-rich membrane protein [Eubacteriales bacterium OttesenSCG-928-N13]